MPGKRGEPRAGLARPLDPAWRSGHCSGREMWNRRRMREEPAPPDQTTAMPANLTPDYRAAEAAFRKARDPVERLECLREMLRVMPKHKGTDHLQGDIKRRIKELSEEVERPRTGGARGGPALVIRPEGAAQIALVGPPNVGKSALHARLTGSGATAAPYPFTTQHPEPGMLPHEDIRLQLVDLPAVSPEHPRPWLGSALQTADAALLVVDLEEPCVRGSSRRRARRAARAAGHPHRPLGAGHGGRRRSLRAAAPHPAPGQQGGPARRCGGRAAGVPGGARAALPGPRRVGDHGARPRRDRPLAVRPSRHRPRVHQGAGPVAQPRPAVHLAARPDRGGRRPARPQGHRALAQVRARVGPVRVRRPAGRDASTRWPTATWSSYTPDARSTRAR